MTAALYVGPADGRGPWQHVGEVKSVEIQIGPAFSPNRDRHRRPTFTQDVWRFLHARGAMRDFGQGDNARFHDDAGYCIDRYSSIDFGNRP